MTDGLPIPVKRQVESAGEQLVGWLWSVRNLLPKAPVPALGWIPAYSYYYRRRYSECPDSMMETTASPSCRRLPCESGRR